MKDKEDKQQELVEMIADHMEKGFLENIIDMFKHDRSLYPIIGKLIKDERLRVRIGAIALIEELRAIGAEKIEEIADLIVPLLSDENPVIRGDVAHSLGIAGLEKHIPHLKSLLLDENRDVREIANDSIEEIEERLELSNAN